jgi:uncharacterized protein YjgD (DUF1641 family)
MENDKVENSILEDGISSAKIYEIMTQILHRLDSLEKSASNVEAIAGKLPAVMSITTDAVDEFYANAVSSGIDMDDRLKNGLKLLAQLTEPKAMKALSLLLEKMDSLEPLLKTLDSLPNTLAVIVDSFDEMYKNAARSGVDIESLMKQASDTALMLNELLKSDELKALMNSGVLNPKTVYMVGQAGCALANCKDDQPERVGIIGLLKAICNRDLQRAVGFLVRFGKRFGHLLDDKKS